ncbi:hypothetical protein NPIL_679511, partial [Nephila pilipes]
QAFAWRHVLPVAYAFAFAKCGVFVTPGAVVSRTAESVAMRLKCCSFMVAVSKVSKNVKPVMRIYHRPEAVGSANSVLPEAACATPAGPNRWLTNNPDWTYRSDGVPAQSPAGMPL